MKKGISILFIFLGYLLGMVGLVDAATLHSGPITSNETWTLAGSPHIINALTTVRDGATLTIEPGVEVRFNENATNPRLIIGELGTGSTGKLIAQGTASQKIKFTSNATIPQPGDWNDILFASTASNDSIIEYAIIEYGGRSLGNIRTYTSNPTIKNCVIRKSLNAAVYLFEFSDPVISNCQIEENDGIGVEIIKSSPVLNANAFINNGSYPISINNSGLPEPIIYGTNTFSGNSPDQILFDVYEISHNHTLRYIGIPYFFAGLTVVNSGATLTIEPGVEVRFNEDALNPRLIIGEIGGTTGKLIAQGTPSQKIKFTSDADTPQPGDWSEINFNSTSLDSIIDYAIIEYGGADGSIDIYGSSPTISNCLIRRNLNAGIHMYGSGNSPVISCCDITENNIGIHNQGTSTPTIINNNIFDNITYGLQNSTSTIILAENNWWGHASGPGGVGSGNGDSVSAGVDYDPWLTEINSCIDGLLYTPVTPCRIVDTRKAGGVIPSGGIRSYSVWGDVASQGGNPDGCPSPLGEPSAVHISVAAVDPTGQGNVKAFPYGASTDAGLTVNFASIGTNLNNAGTVKTSLGSGPDISLAAQYAGVHATVQVLGYYYPHGDFLYTPVTPCKIIDTRNTTEGIIDASETRAFNVYGGGGTIGDQGGNVSGCFSPLGEPSAVHISMAAVDPTGKGNLKAFPYGAPPDAGLTVNFASIGTNLNNAGTVKTVVGSGPDISLSAQYAGVHATAQVLGYYYPDGDLLYTPVTPCRIVDTRNTSAGMIDAFETRDFHVYGDSSTISAQGGNTSGCASPLGEPSAVHISVAAVDPTGKGNIKAFPVGASPNAGLTVNYASIGTNLNNAGTVKASLGTGPDISLAAQYAGTHATVQVLGYYYSQP